MSLLQPVHATFRAVAETVVPETTALRPDEWGTLEREVSAMLAARPEHMQRQFVLFLRAIDYLAVARHLRTFRLLSTDRRTALLESLQRSRWLLVRRGMWGVRTLVFMGYYTQDDVQASIGYRPHPNGWSARRTPGEMRIAAAAEAREVEKAAEAVRTGHPWDPPLDSELE